MQARELEVDMTQLLAGPDSTPRSKGLHVSQIYRDLENSLHKNRPDDESLSPDERKRLGGYRSMGFAWERAIERSLAEAFASGSVIRPGEHNMDGVLLTPDLYDIGDNTLEEWKATWRSMRRFNNGVEAALERDFWVWGVQIKSYLRALGTRTARLRVFFVNGDYRDSGPTPRMWHIEYSQQEIEENWAMLLSHARRRGWLK